MDAGLAWTMVGSVAGAAGATFAGFQVWQSRRAAAPVPGAPSATGLPLPPGRVELPGSQGVKIGDRPVQVNQFFAPPAPGTQQAAGLVVAGEIPQEPPGWQPRPGRRLPPASPGPLT